MVNLGSSGREKGELEVGDCFGLSEFGFVVMGHEFDQKMIRNVKNWDWFLEEPTKDSDFEKREEGKRKIGKDNEDDEWTGESEDDIEALVLYMQLNANQGNEK
ncbi:putative SMAD/FHA domain-containing protein [Quillaja saponaria]|uniref:SMAD/FHA domain-containing protein n=1 Tax=Quillaja saponaria TaxID=32244 RepID=A0AAD7LS35_QUISA|nr:putative SMAD/FHA domain-containing protein [Quillaja saponaria]